MDPSDAKIMIESGGLDYVLIDWITFETYSGTWYGIDGYCAFDQTNIDYYLDSPYGYQDWVQVEPECPLGYSHLHFCVDSNVPPAGCGPTKQIWYFDVSSPNEYIFDSVWEDGTAVVPQIISCNPSNQPIPSPTNHPSKRPTTPSPTDHLSNRPSASPTNDPSNGPTASPITTHDPSNQPTDSPSYDPSKGPTDSPNEPTLSPTDNPFAQPTASPTEKSIHAVSSKTPSPIQSMTDTTILSIITTKHMDKIENSSSNETLHWIIVLVSLCVAIVCVICIICLLLRKTKALSAQKSPDVKPATIARIQSTSQVIVETDACVIGDIRIVNDIGVTAGNIVHLEEGNADQSSDDDILDVVNQTIGGDPSH